MELKDIATVSGKSGLYKVVKPTRTGVILESMDAKKKRFMAGPSMRVSLLKEISIYVLEADNSKPLEDVLKLLYQQQNGEPVALDPKEANEEALTEFMEDLLPTYDSERVYPSDIKKLISWYNAILEAAPEVLQAEENPESSQTTEAHAEAPSQEQQAEEEEAEQPKAQEQRSTVNSQ